MLILFEGTDKNQLEPGQDYGGVSVLVHCSLLRHFLPKPTGVLEHCREGGTKCCVSILQGVSF
jgi:hypothetical protein